MGAGFSSCSHTTAFFAASTTLFPHKSKSNFSTFNPHFKLLSQTLYYPKPTKITTSRPSSSALSPINSGGRAEEMKTQEEKSTQPISDLHNIDPELIQRLAYDALVWSSIHGLLVGDKSEPRSGKVPGVGLVHAPIALLPMSFPESHWKQACEVSPIFNELIDRVSLDGEFLQDSLSRTKMVDAFTSRLMDIHSQMLENGKREEIRLGLHRSDYMLDEQTKLLLQIEINTISASFPGLGSLVSELHRSLLNQYKEQLGLDSRRIPRNAAVNGFAEALAKAWEEYSNPRAVVMFVVQTEERNMYDQHWLSTVLKERYDVTTIRKTLAEIDEQGVLQPDGTLLVGDQAIGVIYFRAGYAPTDYPSESEWRARLLMEQSSAIKCPSISYHLAGTKKIQQELAKPNVLERFLENKDDIAKIQKCFAGLWSLDDSDIVKDAIERPEFYVMKPQREGGGNNIYGDDVRKSLLRLQEEGTEENAAYILMQRIFPTIAPTYLMRDGICHKDHAMSELGIYGAYLRNKENVIMNEQCGYLMRTKVSSSNEGGVAAGFAVLDSVYLN
ncbi:glutathione synthetase, chloroplastic [Rhododendron vialii]|uniref:glutathione synthetase, chloroplastic n=1 Tax=Rhododendron vialii TaxID=182163 RepID=UPI00265DA20A|nr:glutathione synthetase, chloroplastic [Rhododendron vialii]